MNVVFGSAKSANKTWLMVYFMVSNWSNFGLRLEFTYKLDLINLKKIKKKKIPSFFTGSLSFTQETT